MIDRREFLRMSVLTVAGVACASQVTAAPASESDPADELTIHLLEAYYFKTLYDVGRRRDLIVFRGDQCRNVGPAPLPNDLREAWLEMDEPIVGQAVVYKNNYMLGITMPKSTSLAQIDREQYDATKPKGLNPSGVMDPRKHREDLKRIPRKPGMAADLYCAKMQKYIDDQQKEDPHG